MNGKTVKNRKQTKPVEKTQNRSAQIMFAIFAILLILSMVLSAVTTY
jgi:predicted nucleic acid-binding Zn ribbon protein